MVSIFLKFFNLEIFNVLTYSSTRMILAFLSSFLITIFLGPFFIKRLKKRRVKENIKKEKKSPLLGELHQKKQNTPTMGGILIVFSILVSAILWMDFEGIFTKVLIVSTVGFFFLGLFDDYVKLKNKKGISAKKKFLFQFLTLLILKLV